MDSSKFKQSIEGFLDKDAVSVNLDFIVHGDSGYSSFATNPNTELKEEIIESFTGKLRAYYQLNDFKIISIYDDNPSETQFTFYSDFLDKNEIANEIFNFVREDMESFDFRKTSLSELFGVVIELDNGTDKLKIFKKTYPIQVVKERSTHNFFAEDGGLKLFKKDLFQLNDKIHLINFEDKVIIVAHKVYLDYFGFKEMLREKAELNLLTIHGTGHFEINERINVGSLSQSYQKKLKSCVETSPIFKNRNFVDLQEHTKKYSGREIKLTDTGFFKINSKKDLEVLIDFLNRDYNKNEVTGELFKTPSKKLVKSTTITLR